MMTSAGQQNQIHADICSPDSVSVRRDPIEKAGGRRAGLSDELLQREGSLPGPARYPPAFSTVHTDQEPGKGYLHVLDTATEVLEKYLHLQLHKKR